MYHVDRSQPLLSDVTETFIIPIDDLDDSDTDVEETDERVNDESFDVEEHNEEDSDDDETKKLAQELGLVAPVRFLATVTQTQYPPETDSVRGLTSSAQSNVLTTLLLDATTLLVPTPFHVVAVTNPSRLSVPINVVDDLFNTCQLSTTGPPSWSSQHVYTCDSNEK
jgi:hypothetical protein